MWIPPPIVPSDTSYEKSFVSGSPLCCYCALSLKPHDPPGICRVHIETTEWSSDWSIENRIYCSFIHDGIELPRVSDEERTSDADLFRDRYTEDDDGDLRLII